MDPVWGMLKDEEFCIFILVITSVTLDPIIQKLEVRSWELE
jgi:hypothetical protein